MKIRDLIICAAVVILWESLFGHTSLLGAVEPYPVFCSMILFAPSVRNLVFVFGLGIVAGLVAVETIGLASFAFVFAALLVLVLNRFSQILNQEMSYIAIGLFLAIFKLSEIVLLYIFNSYLDTNILNFVLFVITHLVLAYVLKSIIKPGRQDNSFIV